MNAVATMSGNVKAHEGARLITRSEMLVIARLNNLFVTKSTIHRWANEPGFPRVVGVDGRNLLYRMGEFFTFVKTRLRRVQAER